jgi:Tfp pilus assembly protein PilF
MDQRFPKFGQAAGYPETSPSEITSRNIFLSLIDARYVKGTPNVMDKFPGFDGIMEMTDLGGHPMGPLYVQLKTLQAQDYKKPKHQCEKSFLSACGETGLPVVLVAVNQQDKIAYWLHINDEVLLDAETRIKGESVTVGIPVTNVLDGMNTAYIEEWTAMVLSMKKKVHGFDDLVKDNSTYASEVMRLEKKVQEHEKWALIAEETKQQYFTAELDSLNKLRKEGHHDAVLAIIDDESDVRWKDLSLEQTYKRTVAKALTYMDLNNYEKAAPLLISLANHSHQQADTFSLVAVGYLIAGDRRKAETFARKSIAKDPNDPNGYSVLIKLSGNSAGKKALKVPNMPPAVADNIIIKVSEAKSLEDLDQPAAACAIYEKLVLNDLGDEVLVYDIRSYHGIALAQSISYPELMLKDASRTDNFTKAEEARELLTQAIDYFKQTDLLLSRYYIFINRGVVNKLLGATEASIADFQRAYEINKSYITLRYLMINGPPDQWNTLMAVANELPLTADEKIEFAQLTAEQMLTIGKSDEALHALQPYTERKAIKGKHSFGYILLADVYAALGRNGDIDKLVNRLERANSKSFVYYFLAYRQRAQSGPIQDNSELKQNLLTETEKLGFVWARTMTFELFYRNRDFDFAAAIYEPICSKTSFNELTKSFLQAVFFRGWYRKTEDWIGAFTGTKWESAFLIDMLSTIYDRTKSRGKAIAVISDFLDRQDSELLRIKLALLYIETGDVTRAKEQLVKVTTLVPASPVHAFYLAQAYMKVGMTRQGLELAYAQLRDSFRLFEQHQNYQQFIQTTALGSRQYREEGKIALDRYIELERDGETKDFVLVSSAKYENEIGLTDLDVNELFGKVVGEAIPLDGKQWVVKRAISKYAWLFQNSVSFTSGMGEAHLEPSGEGLKEAIAVREALVVEQIRTAVRSHTIMELLAFELQINVVHFWRKIAVRYDVPIFAVASEAEREALVSPIPSGGLLFDISTLVTLHEANLWSIVDALDNPKYIAFSTVRILDEYVSLLQLSITNGERKLYKLENGELIDELLTAEMQQAEEKSVRDLRKQILDRFEVLEGQVPEDYLLYLRNVQGVGRCNFDSLLAGEQKNAAIVTDDAFFRQRVGQQYPYPLLSITHLLFHLVAQHKLSAKARNDAMSELFDRNFYNFPISPTFLYYLYEREQDSVGPKLKRALQSFKGGPIDITITLMIDLLRPILSSERPLENKQKAAFDLFLLFFSFDISIASKTLFSNRIDLDQHLFNPFKELLNQELGRAYLEIDNAQP